MLGANALVAYGARHDVVAVSGQATGSVVGVPLEPVDLAEPGAADAVIGRHRPDLVLHCAALTDVDACEADPDAARRANRDAAARVAEACRRHGAALVHVSTDSVYGGPGPHREDEPVGPVNVYARSKADGELAVLEVLPSAIVVRTTMHGWRPAPRVSFSESILRSLLRGERPTLFRDVSFSPLVAGEIAELAQRLWRAGVEGVVNVGSADGVDKAEFGRVVARGFGLDPAAIEEIDLAERRLRAARPLDCTMDVALLTAAVGPPPTVADGVERLRRELGDGTAARLRGRPGRTMQELLGGDGA
jgi:dTDP-4-dehydrorhamnose reductase